MKVNDLLKNIKDNNPKIKEIKKLNIGFTNEVYSIDNESILKVCINDSNEKRFFNEKDFYLKNTNNNYIPKLFNY